MSENQDRRPEDGGEAAQEQPFVFQDRRRIDPETGMPRGAAPPPLPDAMPS